MRNWREIARIGGFKDAIPYLLARPYTDDAEEIASDIRSASSIIMPSKREGFGLAALEGIAAGIPILISAESGLAELLLFEHDITAAIGEAVAEACVADVDGTNAQAIIDDWAARVQTTLSDRAVRPTPWRRLPWTIPGSTYHERRCPGAPEFPANQTVRHLFG